MAGLSLSIDLRNTEAIKLHVWELRKLQDEMRVAADPYAERLEKVIDRFLSYGDDDRPHAKD